MLAGPGAISTVMVLVGDAHVVWKHAMIYATILVTAFISYLVLAGADRVGRYLGETGIRILMRLMGLLLVALAVQFVANGLTDFGLLKPLLNPTEVTSQIKSECFVAATLLLALTQEGSPVRATSAARRTD